MKKNGIKIKSSISVDEIVFVMNHKFEYTNHHSGDDAHDYPEILYVLSGTVYVTADNENFVLNEGELFIYPPNCYHKRTHPFKATGLIISFRLSGNGIDDYYKKIITLNNESKFFFINLMEEALNKLSFADDEISDSTLIPNKGVTPEEIEILKKKLEIFILMLSNQVTSINKHSKSTGEILSIIETFNDNIRYNYSNEELAKLNSISESKLKYLFRENFNTSPYAYFQKLKIEHAKKLLLDGKKSVTEIAEMLGFQTIHYFSRFFKKHVGISPREYTKLQKTNYTI